MENKQRSQYRNQLYVLFLLKMLLKVAAKSLDRIFCLSFREISVVRKGGLNGI